MTDDADVQFSACVGWCPAGKSIVAVTINSHFCTTVGSLSRSVLDVAQYSAVCMCVDSKSCECDQSITSLDPIPCSSRATGHKISDMYNPDATIGFDENSRVSRGQMARVI